MAVLLDTLKDKFTKKESLSIGLDIGSSHIKLVVLERKGKEKTLKKFSSAALAPGIEALDTFVRAEGISGRPVNTSLSGQSVVMRFIDLPQMNKEELRSAIQFEAGELIPFPLEEMILDCAIIREKIKDKKMQVAVAAVKKSAVHERLELLEKVGLTPKIIDLDCFCLANAFTHAYDAANADGSSGGKVETIGLLNIGAQVTNLVILENGALKFSRDIAFGGRESTLGSLASEISSSVDYYENQIGLPIEKLYSSGGAGGLPGITDFISRHLNVRLCHFDVFSGIAIDSALNNEALKAAQGMFVVALGLALR